MARLVLAFIVASVALLFLVALSSCANISCTTVYEMPSGTLCTHREMYTGRVEYYGCNDGRIYNSPEWVKEVDACHK